MDTDGKKLTNKDFRREVYQGLLSRKLVDVQSPSIVKKKSKSNTEISNHKPHVSKHMRLTEFKHQPIQVSSRKCAMCSTKKNHKEQNGFVLLVKFLCVSSQAKLAFKIIIHNNLCVILIYNIIHYNKLIFFLLLVIYFKRIYIYFI